MELSSLGVRYAVFQLRGLLFLGFQFVLWGHRPSATYNNVSPVWTRSIQTELHHLPPHLHSLVLQEYQGALLIKRNTAIQTIIFLNSTLG